MDLDISQYNQNVNSTDQDKAARPVDESQQLKKGHAKESETNKVDSLSADKESKLNGNAHDIDNAVAEIEEFTKLSHRNLSFSIDEESSRPVVKVTDASTGEVIRQLPSEEVLELSERIKNLQTDVSDAVGVLFYKQV